MYALFFEDSGELIATVDHAPHAIGLGRLVSREKGRPVVAVLNDKDGSTELCWRFVEGRQAGLQSSEEMIPSAAKAPAPRGKDRDR